MVISKRGCNIGATSGKPLSKVIVIASAAYYSVSPVFYLPSSVSSDVEISSVVTGCPRPEAGERIFSRFLFSFLPSSPPPPFKLSPRVVQLMETGGQRRGCHPLRPSWRKLRSVPSSTAQYSMRKGLSYWVRRTRASLLPYLKDRGRPPCILALHKTIVR